MLTDHELVAAFEDTTLPAGTFTHAAHVRVAWCYLRRASLPEALLRFSMALRRFAQANGAAGKYHETITVAYLLIIADRMARGVARTWAEFATEDPTNQTPSTTVGWRSAPRAAKCSGRSSAAA